MRTFSSLTEILDEAAAGRDLRRYLGLRGIKTIGTLALLAADEDQFQKNLIDPLMASFGTGSDRVHLPEEEKPIARAVLLHTWSLAKSSWARYMAPLVPAVVAPSSGGTSAAAASGTSERKVPRALPPGKWSELVAAYNNVTLNGKPRSFPVKELLGAETVITRLWYERHISKMYTPLQLGELLQQRSFTASGEINPLSKSPKKSGILTVDEERNLVEADDPTWVPRSVLSVLDGLQAARWAQTGDEEDVNIFIEQMVQRARSKPDRMSQFVTYWHAAMWRVAIDMRSGEPFGKATQTVCEDLAFYHDMISKEAVDPKVLKAKQAVKAELADKFTPRNTKGGKAGKGSYGSDRYQPYNRQRWNDYSGWKPSSWNQRGYQSQPWHRDGQQAPIMVRQNPEIGTARGLWGHWAPRGTRHVADSHASVPRYSEGITVHPSFFLFWR